jgi:hypothetical protein
MTFDDVKLLKYTSTGAKRFGFWIHFRDQRPVTESNGIRGRKKILEFFEERLGPLGEKWNYQKIDKEYILKLNSDRDLLFLLLRLRD